MRKITHNSNSLPSPGNHDAYIFLVCLLFKQKWGCSLCCPVKQFYIFPVDRHFQWERQSPRKAPSSSAEPAACPGGCERRGGAYKPQKCIAHGCGGWSRSRCQLAWVRASSGSRASRCVPAGALWVLFSKGADPIHESAPRDLGTSQR